VGAEDADVSVVSVLSVAVRPGAEDDLVRAFAEHDVFGHSRRSGGFVGGRLLRPLEPGDPFLVVAEWDDPESYRGWLDHPIRADLSAALEPLLAEHVVPGRLYEEAL
jgi:heme-degrading monooxygenase HmoA